MLINSIWWELFVISHGLTYTPETYPAMDNILQRYFQVSPKLLGFGEACPGVLKVSCCMGFTKFGDKCVNNLDLLYYVVGVACLHREDPCRRICMHLDSRTSCLFAMLCFSSFCCIFKCTTPKQTLLMSARSSFH